jgi:hypothetical protein
MIRSPESPLGVERLEHALGVSALLPAERAALLALLRMLGTADVAMREPAGDDSGRPCRRGAHGSAGHPDFVGPAQLGVLPPQPLQLRRLLARRAGAVAGVDLGLARPLAHRLRGPYPSFWATALIAAHCES